MVWNNGDGSDLMEGGAGPDTAEVNGSDGDGDVFTIAAERRPGRLRPGQPRAVLPRHRHHRDARGQRPGGDDTITGAAGLDGLIKLSLDGGDGNDTITGGDGDDTLPGRRGNDVLVGFRGNDTMRGGAGNDTMVWNNGDGTDLMDGGAGHRHRRGQRLDTDGDEFTIEANGARVDFDRMNLVPFSLDIGTTEPLRSTASAATTPSPAAPASTA